ncbi:MAG: ribonuclease P protein component [Planctomycetota bacterium]
MSRDRAADFPKSARLRTQREFDRVHRLGLKIHARYFLARVALRDSAPADRRSAEPLAADSRLGLRVAKRHGNAVQRNRIKRLLREGFRRVRRDWACAADVVLIPKTHSWDALKLADLQDDFARLERQIRRLARETQAAPSQREPMDGAEREPSRQT